MPTQPPRSPPRPPTRRERRELARAQTPRVRAHTTAAKRPLWQSPLVVVSVGAVLAIALLIVTLQRPGGSDIGDLVPPPANAAATLADGEAIGRADAPVRLEVWADFQCPVCGTLVKDYFPRLGTDFVIPGAVRIVSHDIAILGRGAGDESLAAAVAARCAGVQGKYWAYHDWLYANQRGENRGAFLSERLAAIANGAGLDVPRWEACLADRSQASAIQRNTTDAQAIGITSTPSFRFGGRILVGLPRTYGELATAIRSAVETAAPVSPGTSQRPSDGGPAGSGGTQ